MELLRVRPDGTYVDCTLGGGGHAGALLSRLRQDGRLIAIDRDREALAAGESCLRGIPSSARWETVHGNFGDIADILDQSGAAEVDGILADIGVSSPQMDQADRGFAYSLDGPLDMRMDRDKPPCAATLVNREPASELIRIFSEYGEERYAGRIATAIVKTRQEKPIETTGQLAGIVLSAMPAAARREPQHPARRVFQALRIAVNEELDALRHLLRDGPRRLRDGGRMCVITFHSLEDRLVKERFRELENPCRCPRELPVCRCGAVPLGRQVNRRPVIAGEAEINVNPRARSAKLRCFERVAS